MKVFLKVICPVTFICLILGGIGIIFSSQKVSRPSVPTLISYIPPAESQSIASFFDLVLNDSAGAYTLFGEKPCCLVTYLYFTCEAINSPSSLQTCLLKEGWRNWSKYAFLFPSHHFILREISDDKFGILLLINKKATIEEVRLHLLLFQRELHCTLSAEEIVRKMEEDVGFLRNMSENSLLLGVLLGYGEKNTWGFQRRMGLAWSISQSLLPPSIESLPESLNPLSQIFVKGYSHLKLKSSLSSPSPGFSSLVEELNHLTKENYFPFELPGSDFFLEEARSPVFIGINDFENQRFQRHYSVARDLVIQAYQKKPFLEVVLTQWMKK